MAEIKISELTSGSALDGTEVVPIVQDGSTVKVTTQDIADLGGGGGGTNPTSGFYPINDNGVFADGGLTNVFASLPIGYSYVGLKFEDNYNSLGTLLELNPSKYVYTFGQAEYQQYISVSASGGLAIYPDIGGAIIGCGISNPSTGVFKVNSSSGLITIGNSPLTSIGVDIFSPSIRIGSNLIGTSTPSNTSAPVTWVAVTDENYTTYYMPLYQ